MRRIPKKHTVPPVSLVAIALAAVFTLMGCGTASTTPTDQETNETLAGTGSVAASEGAEQCSRRYDMPIVWPAGIERIDDHLDDWPIEESTFVVMSSYWALTATPMMVIAADARPCVGPNDQWMLVAEPPGIAHEDPRWPVADDFEPVPVDTMIWDRVTAQPWRLVAQGPVGEPGEAPYHSGVAKFTNQTVVTSAACDTRTYLVRWVGETLVPGKWPASFSTEICVPPPGVERLPSERASEWYLPIGGTLAFDGDTLVITYDGIEYRYTAITDEEFAADFNRDSFTTVEDPLNPIDAHLGDSFDIYDNFYEPSRGD